MQITDTNVVEVVKSLNDYFIDKLLKREYVPVAYSESTITIEICGFRFSFFLHSIDGGRRHKYLSMFDGSKSNMMTLEFPNETKDEIFDALHSAVIQHKREALLAKRDRIDEEISKLQ